MTELLSHELWKVLEPHLPKQRRRAGRRIESGQRLGRCCWVVERTLEGLSAFRRLRVPHKRRPDVHQAFLSIACTFSSAPASCSLVLK